MTDAELQEIEARARAAVEAFGGRRWETFAWAKVHEAAPEEAPKPGTVSVVAEDRGDGADVLAQGVLPEVASAMAHGPGDVLALAAELGRLRKLLRSWEWRTLSHSSWRWCPLCSQDEHRGHAPGCALASALASLGA